MLIVGAGGHAKEIFGILNQRGIKEAVFYDDVSAPIVDFLFQQYPVLHTPEQAKEHFRQQPLFVLGIGSPTARAAMVKKMMELGGQLNSIISPYAIIGSNNNRLGEGLNIMTYAVITEEVKIGQGCLLHINTVIHHDCVLGDYCEVSTGAVVLGKASVGSFTSIGARAVIMPGVKVGDYCRIGAGAVVTRNVADNTTVKGVPAK